MPIAAIRPNASCAVAAPGGRTLFIAATCLAMLFASPVCSAAGQIDDFPKKPIRVIHGFAAGGDVFTRILAAKLSDSWKQQLVVDNRPGAGGTVGARLVATATPDGYTLLSATPAHATAPSIYSKVPYDTIKDFAGVAVIAGVPVVLVVNNALGVKSVSELITLAKSRPGQLNFASAGVGSGTHFFGESFKSLAGIDVVHVPYKGVPEALTDTMSGRVQYFLSPLYLVLPFIKDGKVLALGVSTQKQRVSMLPDVPTIAEAGLAGYHWSFWYGFLAPAKTPRPLIAWLNREITRNLDLPEMRQRWSEFGAEPVPMTPEQLDKFIAAQIDIISKLARAAGIKAE